MSKRDYYEVLGVSNRLADKSPVCHIDGVASIKCILFLYSTNLQMIPYSL